jgi:hypothetical protein
MIDQVLPDGVVTIHGKGDLQLGSDAVDAGDEDGLAELARVEGEEAAEASDLAQHLAAMGRGQQLRQGGLDAVPQIDVNARAGVGFAGHAGGS